MKLFYQKMSKDMVLIESYAEWQNHCSFCAVVVVVSVAHEDQARQRVIREGRREQTITQRTSQ